MAEVGPESGFSGTPDRYYLHSQDLASADWTIEHNLGKRPSITIVDSGGTTVYGQVIYLDDNTAEVHFTAAFSGRAYCN